MAITDATNPQAVTAATPAQNNAATTPNTNDLDLSLDLPPVAKEATPDTDRLKEEDKLVQKTIPSDSTLSRGDGWVSSKPGGFETEAKIEILEENLPQDAKEMTLTDDMNIIKNLENTATATSQLGERILETKNPDPVVATPPVIEEQPSTLNPQQAQPSTINLDSLLADTPSTAAPVVGKSPFDLINTPAQQVAQPAVITAAVTAAQPMVDKKKGVKIGLFVLLFVALGFLTYFIISTMYPMWFFASNTNTGVTISETTGEILTGEVVFTGTEIVMTETGIVDSWHASATDPAFTDINDLIDNTIPPTDSTLTQDTIVVRLNNYQELGTKYLAAAKTANDLQSMKYAIYLKNKSQTVLDEIIANPNAITTMQSDLTTQLAQFETFLSKLKATYGDLSASASTQTTPDQILNSLTQE